jgi:hypothetical protein
VQGTNAKQKERIYDILLELHGDKENADINKNYYDRCITHALLNSIINLNGL